VSQNDTNLVNDDPNNKKSHCTEFSVFISQYTMNKYMRTPIAEWLNHDEFHKRTCLEMITPVHSSQAERWYLTFRDEHDVHWEKHNGGYGVFHKKELAIHSRRPIPKTRAETDPVSETLCFCVCVCVCFFCVFRIPEDGQSPETQ
jgi:hypothetical protein